MSELVCKGQRGIITMLAFFMQLSAEPATFEQRKADIMILLHQRDYSSAVAKANILNRDRPDDIVGYQLLAEAQLGLGDYEVAEQTIQWMLDLRIGKADTSGWLLLARFREVTGDIEGALEAVNLANSHRDAADSQRTRLLLYAARLHFLAGRIDLADRALQAAGSSNDPMAVDTLLLVRRAQGRSAQALRDFRTRSGSVHPRQMYLAAEISGDSSDYESFVKAAETLMQKADNANVELALYYAGPGKRPSQALQIARQEATRRHDVYTISALAVALHANGQTGEAISTMRKVLATGMRDPQILNHANRMGLRQE